MKKTILSFLFSLSILMVKSQTAEELYAKSNFKGLIALADKADSLSKEDLYYVGFAFFQLENDEKSIKMYDKAIEKGLDEDYIYLYKGLSLRYNKQFDKAIKSFKLAIKKNPKSQKNFTELANSFFFQEKYDSALIYFSKARELPYEIGDPYAKIPYIYLSTEKYDRALKEYYISASSINKEDPIYIELLNNIGLLEYNLTKNYEKAAQVYNEMIEIDPKSFDFYPKLIKAYYAIEDFEKGDRLIAILKKEYENGSLPKEFQKYGNLPIAEFKWNDQRVVVYKYLKEPEETLDLMYKIYLLKPDGKSIERTLMTEKTIQFEKNGAKHLLCERDEDGTHHTYGFGWSTDKIEYLSLKKAAISVFNGKLSPGASSSIKKKKKNRQN